MLIGVENLFEVKSEKVCLPKCIRNTIKRILWFQNSKNLLTENMLGNSYSDSWNKLYALPKIFNTEYKEIVCK